MQHKVEFCQDNYFTIGYKFFIIIAYYYSKKIIAC